MAYSKCPACDGYGLRPRPDWLADNGDGPITCVACQGHGVLFEVTLTPQTYPLVPYIWPDITIGAGTTTTRLPWTTGATTDSITLDSRGGVQRGWSDLVIGGPQRPASDILFG